MFPKKNRYITRLGVGFFANAKRVYSPLFVLYYLKNDDKQVKATVIVPKKNVPKAVDRSKIKRKMRSGLISHLPTLEGLNIALYLKSKLKENSTEKFVSEIDFLVKKIK